jgi:hypothetical protein
MSHHGEHETQSRQAYQIASSSIFLALAIPTVALRIWVRSRISRSLGADDAMMVLALISYIMYNAALMTIVGHGGGTHIRNFEAFKAAMNVSNIDTVH